MTDVENKYNSEIHDQYKTEEWRKRRSQILSRDDHKCKWCGHEGDYQNPLQVHHRQYQTIWINGKPVKKKVWDYQDVYLVTLCAQCHSEGHKTFKIPTYDV